MEAKKTILYDEHVKLNGKMADFAGWIMPLWYEAGQSAEHHTTRKNCGLFDICHMGEFEISGPNALDFLNNMLTNDVAKLVDGQAQYNFMLNEKGGVIDDCIVYRFHEEKWMLVVNAGHIDEDFKWLEKHAPNTLKLKNISDLTAKLDLQGPDAPKLLVKIAGAEAAEGLKFFRFKSDIQIAGMDVLVSRTGYTGEIGFELYTDMGNAVKLWQLLLEEGSEFGILPCGLGARDTLRTEAGLPLHGHELHPDVKAAGHPWEFAMSFESDFIGKEALEKQKEAGLDYYVYPFIMDGRRKAMPGWEVWVNGKKAGNVLSGVISPTLENKPIGFAGVSLKLEQDSAIVFKQPGKDAELPGKIAASPFVPLTSRKKMSLFL